MLIMHGIKYEFQENTNTLIADRFKSSYGYPRTSYFVQKNTDQWIKGYMSFPALEVSFFFNELCA
jgi:hypothetical protein